jgi:hypothetical protein
MRVPAAVLRRWKQAARKGRLSLSAFVRAVVDREAEKIK